MIEFHIQHFNLEQGFLIAANYCYDGIMILVIEMELGSENFDHNCDLKMNKNPVVDTVKRERLFGTTNRRYNWEIFLNLPF